MAQVQEAHQCWNHSTHGRCVRISRLRTRRKSESNSVGSPEPTGKLHVHPRHRSDCSRSQHFRRNGRRCHHRFCRLSRHRPSHPGSSVRDLRQKEALLDLLFHLRSSSDPDCIEPQCSHFDCCQGAVRFLWKSVMHRNTTVVSLTRAKVLGLRTAAVPSVICSTRAKGRMYYPAPLSKSPILASSGLFAKHPKWRLRLVPFGASAWSNVRSPTRRFARPTSIVAMGVLVPHHYLHH